MARRATIDGVSPAQAGIFIEGHQGFFGVFFHPAIFLLNMDEGDPSAAWVRQWTRKKTSDLLAMATV